MQTHSKLVKSWTESYVQALGQKLIFWYKSCQFWQTNSLVATTTGNGTT